MAKKKDEGHLAPIGQYWALQKQLDVLTKQIEQLQQFRHDLMLKMIELLLSGKF